MIREFAAFAFVGTLGFGVDLGVLHLLAPTFGWYVARVLSFLTAASFTWLLNRHFTFATRRRAAAGRETGIGNEADTDLDHNTDDGTLRRASLGIEYLRYLSSMLAGGIVNYVVYALVLVAVDRTWAPALGVALGSIAGLAINFLAARHLVFKAH